MMLTIPVQSQEAHAEGIFDETRPTDRRSWSTTVLWLERALSPTLGLVQGCLVTPIHGSPSPT